MKEGAIIHRFSSVGAFMRGVHAKRECPLPKVRVTSWILAGSNHRALPCAVPATHMKEGDEK